MELEVERRSNELVRVLLERKLNIESDALAACFKSAAVGGLHDAGPSAGGHDKAVTAGGDGDRPLGQHVSEFARVFVVAGHVDVGLSALQVLFELSWRNRRVGIVV